MQMFHVYSETDEEFGGIVLAADEEAARSMGWKRYTEHDRKDEWGGYHSSAEELSVRPLGDRIFATSALAGIDPFEDREEG